MRQSWALKEVQASGYERKRQLRQSDSTGKAEAWEKCGHVWRDVTDPVGLERAVQNER